MLFGSLSVGGGFANWTSWAFKSSSISMLVWELRFQGKLWLFGVLADCRKQTAYWLCIVAAGALVR